MGANFNFPNWQFPPNNVKLDRRVQNIRFGIADKNNKLKRLSRRELIKCSKLMFLYANAVDVERLRAIIADPVPGCLPVGASLLL